MCSNQPWLDDLRRQLVRRNLPGKYVQRFIEEAADHLEDLTEETMEEADFDLNTVMGETRHVAEAAVATYRQRSFLGRHPAAAFFTFAVSPLVAFLVMNFAVLAGFLELCYWSGLMDSDGLHLGAARGVVNHLLPVAHITLPSMLLSFFYCRLARRTVVGKKWMLMACCVVVVVSSGTYCELKFREASDHGFLAFEFGVRSAMQIAQFLIAAAFTWWLIWRSDRRQPQLAA